SHDAKVRTQTHHAAKRRPNSALAAMIDGQRGLAALLVGVRVAVARLECWIARVATSAIGVGAAADLVERRCGEGPDSQPFEPKLFLLHHILLEVSVECRSNR